MDDFYATAQRMWKDANVLYNSPDGNSYFNTCYLSGYVLECYGKLLIKLAGTGEPKDYSHNIRKINEVINNQVILESTYSKYCIDFKVECGTILKGKYKWHANNRYSNDISIWNSSEIAQKYIKESKVVIDIINEMKADGRIIV